MNTGVICEKFDRAIYFVNDIIDKYRMRIEPTDNGKKTEVHFTLNSMEEVITNAGGEDENTIWQA
jgi:outer membrane protein assembly factor BamC